VDDTEKQAPSPPEPELTILPTMGWACRTLGVSSSRVWSLVTKGTLSHPTRKGTDVLFIEDEVLALVGKVAVVSRKKQRDEGELYACLFTHFESKTPFARIVVQEKVSPDTVREAYKEYKTGFDVLPTGQSPPDRKLRGQLEVLSRKERIKALELELAETRGRNREHMSSIKSQAARSLAHERTLSLITGNPLALPERRK
jgi:hypothetical protein